MPADLHFLRPEWFLALPVLLLVWPLHRRHLASASSWERAIDPALLGHLLDRSITKAATPPFWLIAVAWVIAITALAGPAWDRVPQPVQERQNSLVILLDLSLSMRSTDVRPDRLTAAKRKLRDLLEGRDEGTTGMIVYARDAHLVSPLTDDANTIINMLPALDPSIMPLPGSRLAPALELAAELQRGGGANSGRLLVITDEIRDVEAASDAAGSYEISVLGVGTATGAPIPLQQGYLKDSAGVMVIPALDAGQLRQFADRVGGRFATLTLGDADLEYLLAPSAVPDDEFRAVDRDFDVWFEEGPWLVLLLLPIAALAFRRGWLWAVLLVVPVTFAPQPAYALEWQDLWQTADQQAAAALAQGDADKFANPEWKAAARYRAGEFETAASEFAAVGTPGGHYNEGNALARLGDLEAALAAYDKTLSAEPEHEDARFNRELIEDLLQQQQQQQNGENGEQQEGEQQDGANGQDQNSADDGSASEQQQGSESSDPSGDQSGDDAEQQTANNGQEPQTPPEQLDEAPAAQDAEEGDEAQQQTAESEPGAEEPEQDEQQVARMDREQAEAEQALRQWLQRVPDDPGGLLRAKFRRKSAERGETSRGGDTDATW